MFFYGVFTKVGSAIQGWINGNYEPKTPVIPRVYHKYLKASDKENLYPTSEVAIGSLTIASAAGTTAGTTKITVTEAKATATNIYKYALGAKAETVTPDQDLTSWTTWNETDDIVVTTETVITVAECTEASLAVKAGNATITVNSTAASASKPDDEDPMAE